MGSKKRPKKKCSDAVLFSASEFNDVYIVLPSIYKIRIIPNFYRPKIYRLPKLFQLDSVSSCLNFLILSFSF